MVYLRDADHKNLKSRKTLIMLSCISFIFCEGGPTKKNGEKQFDNARLFIDHVRYILQLLGS